MGKKAQTMRMPYLSQEALDGVEKALKRRKKK
jgi:hypothetical protein